MEITMLNYIMNFVPNRFPVIISIIAGTLFYLPDFLKAYEHAKAKTTLNLAIALLSTVCIGSAFLFLFNSFLLGWFIFLSKMRSKAQYDLQRIKKLIYAIALSQPILFTFILVVFCGTPPCSLSYKYLYFAMAFLALAAIVIRISTTVAYVRVNMGFTKLLAIVSIIPFIDCWGILYLLFNYR
jgi:hypothetical protein